MFNWFNCYLSGRHEFGVWCEPGAIFLRCVHCGSRSPGWAIDAKPKQTASLPMTAKSSVAKVATVTAPSRVSSHILPFGRAAS